MDVVCRSHPKGKILAAAWGKALHIHNAGLRSQELKRISAALAGFQNDLQPIDLSLCMIMGVSI